jgi:hypothetical protein
MQLVAYGAQDVYLTGNPQITFWKVTYRRHTNFSLESIEQTFNGQADFGRRVTCTISRNGDLAYRTYLQVTLPEINQMMNPIPAGAGVPAAVPTRLTTEGVFARWLDCPGEQLISQVEVEIGGQRIDRQYGDWMHIWNQLTLSAEQERGYNKMIGNTSQLTYITDPGFDDIDGPCDSDAPRQVCAPRNALPETTLYIPLEFWYCRNPGLALPLIALQYHEVKINLDLRPIDECLWAVTSLGECAAKTKGRRVGAAYNQSLVAASLYVDYVFLDTDERRRMAQNPHEYLIEQLQFTGDESVGSSSNKIKLNFNHPCKELIWVVQPDSNVDYCSSLECESVLFKLLGAQPFNYTDATDALPNAMHAFAGPQSATKGNFISDDGKGGGAGMFHDPGASDNRAGAYWGDSQADFQKRADAWKASGSPATMPGETGAAGQNYEGAGGGEMGNSYYGTSVTGQSGATPTPGGVAPNPPPVPALGGGGGFADGVGGAPAWNNVPDDDGWLSSVSDAGSFVLAEQAKPLHCWGENPVVTAKLQLNGQDRFSEREGTYFDLVQPYQHHTRSPDTGINVYSFALRPEEHQPSGTCNFSRIDSATLQLVLSNATVEGTQTAKVRVYATNYNVLRVMSGMGGLAYSN